jgi:signal transduction histidine kinase
VSQARGRSSVLADEHRGVKRTLLVFVVFVAGYVALDRLSYLHPVQQFNITPWNPQPALAVALIMTLGQRWLPAVFAAAWLAERVVRGELMSMEASLLAAAMLTLGYAVTAQALIGPFRIGNRLDTRGDVLRLTVVALAGSLLTGVLYVAALLVNDTGPASAPLVAIAGFWIGDAIGILVTLPLLLMLIDGQRRRHLARLAARPELLGQCAALVLVVGAVFAWGTPDPLKYFYLLFLPIVWVAARSGMEGVAIAAVVAQVAVIVAVKLSAYQALPTFELQALLLALVFVGFFVGVTVDERRRAADELRRTVGLAMAGEMGASIAHELNQPLLAVVAYAKAGKLCAEAGDGERARLLDTLDKLVVEAKRAAEVVRRLRDLFRLGAAQRVIASVDVPVHRAVDGARGRAEALSVTMAVNAGERPPMVLLDPLQIEVVVANLIANALDSLAAPSRPGRIDVTIEASRDAVTVSVRDDGAGIAAADAERVFDPLVTTKATGMGMGLTISRAIVEAHGGRMWIEPGPGGKLHFTLPRDRASYG